MSKAFNKVYNDLKKKTKYNEKIHPELALEILSKTGRISAFCKKVKITYNEYYHWRVKHKNFDRCCDFAIIIFKEKWYQTVEENITNPDFNFKHFERIGRNVFNYGKDTIKIKFNKGSTPWQYFEQMLEHISRGELSATEVKQVGELLSLGTKVHQEFILQSEIDKMKEDLKVMEKSNVVNFEAIESTKKTN
jgi:hypothetical protein